MDADLTDEELVERSGEVPGGDVRAFENLVERYQQRVLANCRYLSGSALDAEDLAQEVFVKAFFGLKRFEGRSKFSTWLQRIKINHCLNFNKKKRRAIYVSLDAPEVASRPDLKANPQAEIRMEARDDRRKITGVLDAMSENLRVPLVLRDSDGLPYAEIADRLDLSLSAVKMRIKRGREEFHRLYHAPAAVQGIDHER